MGVDTMFRPATKEAAKLRLALDGPSGAGKTFTALSVAKVLGNKVALIDSERGSASKYSDIFKFDTVILNSHDPRNYIRVIKAAEAEGYEVIIIDSLSHAWGGNDGALELVDKAAKRMNSQNTFAGWREVTPLHNQLVDALIGSKCHIIATMRTKMGYSMEKNERTGKMEPRKVGMEPIQRDGIEYEFDVVADLNLDHDLIVGKTRCQELDGYVVRKPGAEFAQTLCNWLQPGPNATGKQMAPLPVPQDQSEKSQSPAQEAAKGAAASGSASPAQTTSQTAGVNPDPKPSAGTAETSATSNTTAGASNPATASGVNPTAQPQPATTAENTGASQLSELISKAHLDQLREVGVKNGWTQKQISDFVCHAFGLTPQTLAKQFTVKQWEIAIGLVGYSKNAKGVVAFKADGTALPVANRWPKAS